MIGDVTCTTTAAANQKFLEKVESKQIPIAVSHSHEVDLSIMFFQVIILRHIGIWKIWKAKSSSQIGAFFFTRCLPIDLA